MSGPVVNTHGNIDVPVDIERRSEPLSEQVHDIVIRVGTIVEDGAKSRLPFLLLDRSSRIRGMEEEALEVHLSEICTQRTELEIGIHVIAYAIRAFHKSNFRIEVTPDFSTAGNELKPIGIEIHGGTEICLSAVQRGGAGLGGIAMQNKLFEQDQTSVHPSGFIEGIVRISGSLIHSHRAQIGTSAPK